MSEPGERIMLPRLGSSQRTLWLQFRHKCWRDRLPWYGRRHLLALAKDAGVL